MEIIGNRKELTPQERLLEQARLIAEAERLRPYKKPKGLVIKFKSWEELERFNLERAAKKM